MRLQLDYRIRATGPLHIGTGVGFARMVDDTVVRAPTRQGPELRLPCIPGSSMKGKVRSRCQRLAGMMGLKVCYIGTGPEERVCKSSPCLQCRLFGSSYRPGGLHFSDALLTNEWLHLARLYQGQNGVEGQDPFTLGLVRQGNKLERAARTVEQEFLFSLEHTAEGLSFAGAISGTIDPTLSSESVPLLHPECWALITGLQMVDKLGGMKSRGLGRCKVQITRLMVDGTDFSGEDLTLLLDDPDRLEELANYDSTGATGQTP